MYLFCKIKVELTTIFSDLLKMLFNLREKP